MRTWLSPRGALAAVLVGLTIATGTGWRGVLVLLVFFVTSSLLTPGGGRRRAVQVLANGGVPALCALLAPLDPRFAAAFVGALAAAAADTWSTEIGTRGRAAPRLVTTWRRVAPGTSGGVTALGTAGGAAGALAVTLTAVATGLLPGVAAPWVAAAGLAGALADSLAGAAVQARYRCGGCGADSEEPVHACGAAAKLTGGLPWMTNDAVNVVATLVGALLAGVPVAVRGPLLP